jgi:predicted Zn-dependent peptidase
MNRHPMNARYSLLVGGMLLTASMTAQLDRSHAPAPGPAPIVNLGEHVSFTLNNGMRVIVVENHKLPMVGVQLRFDIPPMPQGEKAGYIDLFGELLTAGTESRSKAVIDETVDGMGASLFSSNDGLYANALKKHLPALMDLMTDVAISPTFPEDELAKARTRAISDVQQRQEDASAIAEVVGRVVTFGRTHPYGEATTDKTLRKIGRESLVGYHKKFFRPEKGYLVFVGDITEKEAKSLAKEHFGKWKPAPVSHVVNEDGSETIDGIGIFQPFKQATTPAGPRRVIIVDRPGAAQSIIRVGHALNFQPKDVRSMSAQVMNTILGGGVFNARLMQNLREDKGWTYGTGSSLDPDRFNGGFHTSASVRTAVTDSAIVETIKEIERMRMQPVTAEELELAKRYMAGSFARSLEDPRTVARFALNTYLNGLPADHYATYLKRLEAVTVADVQAAAEAFLYPDNAVILVVGDKKEILSKLEPLSWITDPKVIELDHNGNPIVEELVQVPGKTAEDVIERYLEAIGGRKAINSILHMRSEIATHLAGQDVTLTQWYGLNGSYKSVMKAAGTVVLQEIFDGSRAVRKDPTAADEELFDIDLQDLRMNGYPVQELHLKEFADRVILAGMTKVDDRQAYKVVTMTHAGTSVSDYYDVETGLKLRRVDMKFMYGESLKVITDYADHQPAGGVLFPRTLKQTGGPTGSMDMRVTSIVVNEATPPNFYDPGLPPPSEDDGE